MKYVLVLYVCSFINSVSPQCFESHIVPLEFEDYKECTLQGYKSSYNLLVELYDDRIEEEKLAMKFICTKVKVGENI